jgi:hypothetical protein
MPERIRREATPLRDQLSQAIAGAFALGLGWPVNAPTVAAMTTARDNLSASITDTDAKQGAWQVAAQLKGTRVATGIPIMQKVDEATTLLYGAGGAEKNNFGLTPEGAPLPPLHKLIEIVFSDGPVAGSLKADWESITGASYEIQWSTTSNFAVIIGSAMSASTSDYIISGLVPGTQYWMHVRPVRGPNTEQWSDPATRVAPV